MIPLIIQDQFYTIQNLQRYPIPQTSNTVDGRGKISEPHATGTSKLDWRSLESMQIDRNKVQIRTNWQKGTGTKKNLKFLGILKILKKKNVKIHLCAQSLTS